MRKIKNIILQEILTILLLIISVLVISISIAFYSLNVKSDTTFLIQENTSTREIAKSLVANNVIDYQMSFYFFAQIYCKILNKPIIAGEYLLKAGSNALELMKALTAGKVIQHQILIQEGLTINQVLKKISSIKNIKHSDLSIRISEGSILADTYFYIYGSSDIDIINRMRNAMNNFLTLEWPKRDKKIDNIISSLEEVVILASIIEKETYIDTEKPLIAGVYLNRLKRNMKLQADPTVVYGLGLDENKDWNRRVLFSHLKIDSPYNTYTRKGLPPTPICNPGKDAILAVLHPQWTEKLFFVSKGSGKHIFASNFEQHKRNIQLVKR